MSSSSLLDSMVEALQVMPGIGPVSATRIAYYLLDRKRSEGLAMAKVIEQGLNSISICPRCRNYTDEKDQECELCSSQKRRNSGSICVVESPSDVMAIESSSSYSGSYFVLHGHLSPIDGIGPEELGFDVLTKRLKEENITEVILALGQTAEGEVTASYIAAIAKKLNISVSKIATGVPVGGELASVDGNTLALSFNFRRKI
ncbi:MAG: recombination protein RecR [Succinivibrio sp.]|nr:recombination protein RecR [Succinivibrio sp.]